MNNEYIIYSTEFYNNHLFLYNYELVELIELIELSVSVELLELALE